jgi:hypothetical protein
MKILTGLSALLLGTAMCAGAAYADPPHWHDHAGQDQGDHDSTPPPSPQSGLSPEHGGPQFVHGPQTSGNVGGGHQDFRFHGNGRNQVRFSHGLSFHDRNVAHFSTQDRSTWTGGHWSHGRRHGRNGWWWSAGGAWFFYDQPIYPYPGYASDYYYEDDYGPDYGAAPEGQYAPPGTDGGYSWYYCNNPPGYYPYVQQCRGPWRPVQPTPPGSQQQGHYDQGPGMSAPDSDQDDEDQDDRGSPPRNGFGGGSNDGPPPDYDGGPNGPNDDQDDQGPPPPPQHY